MKNGLIIFVLIMLGSCAVSPPRNTENACNMLAEKPGWYDAVNDAADSWDVSEGLILSFIRQESSYVADAKPPRTKILWVLPGPRASSAYGYPQAKDGTWGDYRRDTSSYLAERDNFRDAVDFVGWYVDRAHRIAGIPNRTRIAITWHITRVLVAFSAARLNQALVDWCRQAS